MAAEPGTLKTALAIAAAAALGPLAAEYSMLLAGAFGGALLALQRADPMPRWWQPVMHVGGGVLAGTVFGGIASSMGSHYLPDWASPDTLWVPGSAIIAMYWRDAAAGVPELLRRWVAKRSEP